MKKLLYSLGLSVVFALMAAPFMPGTATATPAPSPSASWTPSFAACGNLNKWYVNSDEASRKPTPTVAGLKFEGNQLIHHDANLPLKDLKPGNYTASPAPDQPSFWSVEVRANTGAYGTLRWNQSAEMWQITIGADATKPAVTPGTFSGADPVALLEGKVTKWGAFDATTKVVTFGVGYTNSPPGTVATVVSKVTFQGNPYDLTCKPPVQPSASASSKAPSASSSAVTSLPVTGMSGRAVAGTVGAGLLILGVGVGLYIIGRSRRSQGHFHS